MNEEDHEEAKAIMGIVFLLGVVVWLGLTLILS